MQDNNFSSGAQATKITAICARSAVRLLQQGVVEFQLGPAIPTAEAIRVEIIRDAVTITRGRPC